MASMPRQQTTRHARAGGDTLSGEAQTLTALYAIEREMGFSVQANLLTIWIAATTYLTAAFGILALLLGGSGATLGKGTMTVLMYALPGPACALAGYHLILFGIGLIHSKSIEFLEREIVGEATRTVQVEYETVGIGSKRETAWTEFGNASMSMKIVSAVAFLVPYLSATLLFVFCDYQLFRMDGKLAWRGLFALVVYVPLLATLLGLGIKTVLRGPKASRRRDSKEAPAAQPKEASA